MPYTLNPDAAGDKGNALALAAAAQFAYYPAERGTEAFRAEFGMESQLISVDNTQAYVAWNDQNLLVVFRGSESPASVDGLKDWLMTNANNLLIQPEGPLSTEFLAAGVGCRWHQGFVNAISEIWPSLYPVVEAKAKEKDRVFWIAGHSLGGALALLAGWLFTRKTMAPHEVVTFGAPMVGNKQVAEAIDRELAGTVFRYVNGPDPVPLLPMMSLVANEYLHCQQPMAVGDSAASANLLQYLKDSAGDMASLVIAGELSNKLWQAVMGKITAHLLDDYRKLLG